MRAEPQFGAEAAAPSRRDTSVSCIVPRRAVEARGLSPAKRACRPPRFLPSFLRPSERYRLTPAKLSDLFSSPWPQALGLLGRSIHVRVETLVSRWKQTIDCTPDRYTLVAVCGRRFPDERRLVGLGRVELPTRSLGNCCSIHLSYSPAAICIDFISERANCGEILRVRRGLAGERAMNSREVPGIGFRGGTVKFGKICSESSSRCYPKFLSMLAVMR
jgi:hypothetical protein